MSELLKFQILPEVESITLRLINKLLTNYVEGFNLTIIKEGIIKNRNNPMSDVRRNVGSENNLRD